MSNLELIGTKLGMSREFFSTGQSVPVTILKIEKYLNKWKVILQRKILNHEKF